MDAARRKELMNAYKAKPVVGGVYCIFCSGSQRRWLRSSVDMEGSRSRFQFAVKTKSSPEPAMRQEWLAYGIESFSFECLEELEKGETQTAREFAEDVQALLDMWQEKLGEKTAE